MIKRQGQKDLYLGAYKISVFHLMRTLIRDTFREEFIKPSTGYRTVSHLLLPILMMRVGIMLCIGSASPERCKSRDVRDWMGREDAMKLEVLMRRLESADAGVRKDAWRTLFDKHKEFAISHEDIQFLRHRLKNEENLDIRTYGMLCLEQSIEWTQSHSQETLREETLQDWLFKPFLPPPLSAAGGHEANSAVLAVCDQQHIRDVHPLVMLARFLPADRYHTTDFHQVSLHNPRWEAVGLDKLGAVCFVGRPSMFRNCKLVDALPNDLRFTLPKEDDLWRGKELSGESIDSYHHVRQNRPNAGPFLYRAVKEGEENQRTDYALVQRFRIDYGGRQITVLILAGGTSLGTVGAAEWVTNRRLDNRTCRDVALAAGVGIDDSVRMEVLLEVTAEVHKPAQPWRPHCLAKKMFFNGSPNLLRPGPQTITLGMGNENPPTVRYILFDEDEVRLTGDEYVALVALCLKCWREEKKEVHIADLLRDSHVWPNGKGRFESLSENDAVGFFRDHLKKYRLRGSLYVGSKPMPLLRMFSEIHTQPL